MKLGNNFQEIIRFLENRDESIKDIELAYCLKVIIDQYRLVYIILILNLYSKINKYMPIIAEKYLNKIQSLILAQKIKFNSI